MMTAANSNSMVTPLKYPKEGDGLDGAIAHLGVVHIEGLELLEEGMVDVLSILDLDDDSDASSLSFCANSFKRARATRRCDRLGLKEKSDDDFCSDSLNLLSEKPFRHTAKARAANVDLTGSKMARESSQSERPLAGLQRKIVGNRAA